MIGCVLLVETREGATVAVKFPSIPAARAWQEMHEGDLVVVGVVPVVLRHEALIRSGRRYTTNNGG